MRMSNSLNPTGLRHESNLQNLSFHIKKVTSQSIDFLFAYSSRMTVKVLASFFGT